MGEIVVLLRISMSDNKKMLNRNKVLRVGLLLVMAVIVTRLFFIQIVEHDEWLAKAAAQQTLQSTIVAKRGEIYMMDGDEPAPVVMNATVYTVIVDPMLANREEIETQLNQILGERRMAEWDEVFADKTRRYYVVAKNLPRAQAEQIAKGELEGVWLQGNTERVYPEGDLGAKVLGFVNADGVGQYGVEGSLNERLAGKDGLLRTVKDINNVALSIGEGNIKTPAVDGENIVLTIDKTMQHNIERLIQEQTGKVGFSHISALVMDPRDGRILAMADTPSYDPGDFGNVESAEVYINHVIEDPYEPASVCKTFTFAAGLEYGVLTPESTYVNQGVTYVDNWPIKNAAQNPGLLGTTTIQTALNWSLNTGSTQALRWLGGSEVEINAQGRERLYEYFHNHFGLGQETGIELYEATGTVMEPNAEVYGIDSTYANMTFGQNMQVTMLQTAAGFASVVNGGQYFAPTIIAGKMENGEFVKAEQREAVREAVRPETSATMREMLYNTRRTWRGNGTDPAGYYVGGKTGTAQVIRNGAYVLDETVATYVGFGGTEGELPEYVIMVRVWEDGKKAEGDTHAVVVFNALKGYVQDRLRVRPAATE